MRKDGRWTVDEIAARFDEVGQEPMPILERLAGDGSRGQGEGQAEPAAACRRASALRVVEGCSRRSRCARASTRRRSCPTRAMLCASLRYRGDEYVAWPRTARRVPRRRARPRSRSCTRGPTGSRVRATAPRGDDVDLAGLDLPRDPNGLPIHGNLLGVAVRGAADERRPRVVAAPRLRRAPRQARARSRSRTPSRSTRACTRRAGSTSSPRSSRPSDRAVPISFGWHPFVRLPDAPRAEWELRWPACEHVEVDERVIPTGARTPQARANARRSPRARSTTTTRSAPTARSRSPAAGSQPAHAHAAVRSRVPVRAAVRPAAPRLRRDRTDDRRDRRARARHRARRANRATASWPRSTSRSRRADAGVR